jgi:hypothetical protein
MLWKIEQLGRSLMVSVGDHEANASTETELWLPTARIVCQDVGGDAFQIESRSGELGLGPRREHGDGATHAINLPTVARYSIRRVVPQPLDVVGVTLRAHLLLNW